MTVTIDILSLAPPPATATDLTPGRDITAALTTIIAGASGGEETIVEFPRLANNQVYLLSSAVVIPADRWIRLRARSPRGVVLQAKDNLAALLHTFTGSRPKVFEDLVFKRAGVVLDSESALAPAAPINISRCAFHGIPTDEWCIRTNAKVSNVSIVECEFSAMGGGGVLVGHGGSRNWLIGDNTFFVRLDGPGVETRSGGVRIRDARFENRHSSKDHPYLRIAGDDSQAPPVLVENCRFGGEKEANSVGPPTNNVEIESKTIPVVITASWFFGFTNTREADDFDAAVHAIKCAPDAHACAITANYFNQRTYDGALIDSANVRLGQPSQFLGNAVKLATGATSPPTLLDIFGSTVTDWNVKPLTP